MRIELRNEAKCLCFLHLLERSVCYTWIFFINLIVHRIVAKTSLTSPPWPEVKLPNPVEEAKHHAGKGLKSPSEASHSSVDTGDLIEFISVSSVIQAFCSFLLVSPDSCSDCLY